MRKILVVDDDAAARERLERTLLVFQQEWSVVFVASGQEALTALAQQPCDVVMSDMRMPGMDGAQLLGEVRNRHPHIVRMLLSDQSDQEALLKSVGSAHQCLAKSSRPEVFQTAITRACAVRDLLANQSLLTLVSGMQTLPSLPTLYREVLEELNSEAASIDKIGHIISKDLGMLSKILQVVNSPFYGLRRQISSATQAVALLGLETIKSLVLSMKVFSQFESASQTFFSLDVLWNHGMTTARYARALAKERGAESHVVDDAFTAGLLHDVGLLVLATNVPEKYTETIALAQHETLTEWEAERRVLGATHADVGGYLLGIWGLSDTIVEAVAFHHDPERSAGHSFSALTAVHVANTVQEVEQAEGGIGVPPALDSRYLDGCGLPPDLASWEAACRGASAGR
ncbi:HDOD domain-containing protein [Candidatus Nitrospira bockiana]